MIIKKKGCIELSDCIVKYIDCILLCIYRLTKVQMLVNVMFANKKLQV